MPIYQVTAWTASSRLLLIDTKASPELATHLKITANPTVLGYREAELKDRVETIDPIKAYLEKCIVSK